MRLSVALLLISLAGVLAGAAVVDLLGWPVIGGALIFDFTVLGAWGLLRDDGKPSVPQVHGVPTLHEVLDRARQSS